MESDQCRQPCPPGACTAENSLGQRRDNTPIGCQIRDDEARAGHHGLESGYPSPSPCAKSFCGAFCGAPFLQRAGILEVGVKLLAIEMSRVTDLFRMTRPSGQPYLPGTVTQVLERYRFVSEPAPIDETGGDRLEFRRGVFEDNAIDTLDVFSDGIIVASRSSTDFIDRFIEDLVTWLENDHGYSIIETHTISRRYDSTLLVETDRDIFAPFETYAEILRMIEKELRDSSGLDVAYQNYGFMLSADQARNPALKPIPFRFERKEGIDFSHHQFYTTAPLGTEQHLRILERLEQLVS